LADHFEKQSRLHHTTVLVRVRVAECHTADPAYCSKVCCARLPRGPAVCCTAFRRKGLTRGIRQKQIPAEAGTTNRGSPNRGRSL
jgi:hypothetical protein